MDDAVLVCHFWADSWNIQTLLGYNLIFKMVGRNGKTN